MADPATALANLRAAIAGAIAGPSGFALDSVFLTSGLNDPGVTVPAAYDADLGKAFQVAATAFTVTGSASGVGPVVNGQFTVSGAQVPVINGNGAASATLLFTTTSDGSGGVVLVVQIASAPGAWTWTNSFPYATGYPFNIMPVTAAQFYFSTATGAYPWAQPAGVPVFAGPKQTLLAKIAFPQPANPYLALFAGLLAPSAPLDFSGTFDLSTYGGPDFTNGTILPSGTFTALLSTAQYTFATYLTVSRPTLSISVPQPSEDDVSKQNFAQYATLAFATDLLLQGVSAGAYTLEVQVAPATTGPAIIYAVALTPQTAQLLGPASAIELIGGKGSYFDGTPTFLQQYLTSFGLAGMTLSGTIATSSVSVNQVTVKLGTAPGHDLNWQPLPAPTPDFAFTIQSFALDWSVSNPFTNATFSYLFSTSFSILPTVFRKPDGSPGGVFTVVFTSGQVFIASFDGTASLADFLAVVSAGLISSPASIPVGITVSDISLQLDYNAQTFVFSSGVTVDFPFLKIDGNDIFAISGGLISLSAVSASSNSGTQLQTGSGTVWSGSIVGLVTICGLDVNVSVAYVGGGDDAGWTLAADLAEPVDVSALIAQFFVTTTGYVFPSFLLGSLTITSLGATCFIPDDNTAKNTYTVSTTFDWVFSFGDQSVGIKNAAIDLSYDGTAFSGSATGTWVYTPINLSLGFGYTFEANGNQTLFVTWQGFTATYASEQETVTFTLKGWSIGTLIESLVSTLFEPNFSLPAPWSLLNQISLDGLSITVSLSNDKPITLTGSYTLSSPLDLGFITIKGISLTRTPADGTSPGKVMLSIDGSAPPGLEGSLGNLLKPEGQSVQDMPDVPGQGNEYFKLNLLALGQRVGIQGYKNFASTQAAIAALAGVPQTKGTQNPVVPNNTTPGQPYYNAESNWLIALHFNVLKVGDIWAVDVQLVFNDPDLYGMRLALNGEKTGGLAGFVIDILYKKITDDVGLFQIDFTFPDSIRNLNFGAVSVVLPMIGVQIYTNGDFLIDLGFPYNMDFSRSFSISAIVYGVPVLGSGGVYFGKLSNATATQVPKTQLGTFNPVIVIGIGLQLGLGYNFTKGPLSAGFALTVFGIVEGVFATYHPYQPTDGSATNLQDVNYFYLQGTVGLIGLLYGSIDFKIISASLRVNITLSVRITYESFQPILISATASVSVSVSVKIDLGLFSIHISLSFSTSVTASFVINLPGEGTAPWLGSAGQAQAFASASPRARGGRRAVWRDGALPRQAQQHPAFRTTMRATISPRPVRLVSTTVKPTLSLLVAPQFTVLAPEGATDYAAQQGAYVCQFAMDAPNPADLADDTAADLATSFSLLCASFFPWLLALLSGESPGTIDLATELTQTVNVTTLQSDLDWLGDPANTAFTTADLLQFLADAFTVNIVTTAPADTTSHTLFPLFDGLILTVPDPAGGTTPATITIETYAAGTTAYRDTAAASLREVAASIVSAPSNPGDTQAAGLQSPPADAPQSIASFVLADVFAIIGRSLLQAGIDALANFACPVTAADSIGGIITTLNGYGNDLDTDDIAVPNATAALATNVPLTIADLMATIQSADTLTAIAGRYSDSDTQAARWTTTPAGLIEANGDARILQSGVLLTLTIGGKAEDYTTLPGDSFNQIAISYDISLSDLAGQSSLYGQTGLLLPATSIAIPPVAYKTAAGDTLAGIAATFATTASLVGFDNATVAGLFVPGHIAIARLAALPVEQIWTSITATGEIGQAAGQVARFLAYGLRLPFATGLTFSDKFLYPTNQSSYALYQLTGQQFPTPNQAASYAITLGRATLSHGVDLGFITFGGSNVATSIDVDLSSSYALLGTVLQYAQGGNFVPAPIGSDLPLVTLQPRQFTASGYSLWSTSDFATLAIITGAPANAVAATPYLWSLPQSLLNGLESRQATLATLFDPTTQFTDIVRLMPAYQPRLGTTSPNSPETSFTDITSFAFAARVDFQIARLSPTADAATQDQTASATTVTDAPIYQLIGPSAGDGQRLEYLLTAMAALGDNLVSGLFLLYSAGGSNQTVLTGQADPAFLAFITQTNLSTESTPPAALAAMALAAEPAAPHGVANTPHQFIKLLWKQSVVHGGGYYFYWQFLPSGTGLPAEIFDSSGTATLTLVVTLKPNLNASAGNALPNFVNSFVTTSNIDPQNDAVVVQSQTSVADSAPLTANQTLVQLAAAYGVGVAALAQANPTTGFVAQSQIPFAGILHQLTAQEAGDPAQALANLAAYYSIGALAPMTGAEIATNNPGVAVVAGATFQIPPFTYVVNTGLNPGPGGDFTSLAAYYALPVAAVAVAAASTLGLFAAGSTIKIDTLSQDTQATQAPDNLSFLLTRDNLGTPDPLPPNPTPAQQATYAQQTLFSLYNTLSAGLAANPYFLASPHGLPFGPQDDSTAPTGQPTAGPMHAARARSQTLAALATQEQYRYSQVLGFGGLNASGVPFAKINAAPANPAAGLPPAADSPYIGIGSYACIALRWQDLYGNTTVTPFEQVPTGYTGALNNMPNALRYTDRLIGLSAWPKTQATYIYTGAAGQPSLQLTIKLDATAYDPAGKAHAVAEQDLATYRTIYFQLNQNYKDLGVPGIDGNAVTMIVSNTLLASPDQVLADTDAKTFRDYVAACVIFLENYVAGVTPGTAPTGTLTLSVPIAGLASQTRIPLDVALTLKRDALLVEPLIAGLPDGLAVRSTIAPQANLPVSTSSSSFTVFATALETCWQTSSWYLRTGAGLATVSAGNATQSEQLYAVRFGNVTGAGIYFDIAASAGYYAPLPVATSLQSGSATLDIYATGGGTTTRVANFSSIDLNLWFESCLDAIDKFLSASYAPQAFILDRLNGVADPLADGGLGKILAAKQTLADAIGGTTTPILSSSATDSSTLAAARYTMSQQLLTTLGPAFAAGAVTVFGLTNVTGADSFGAGGPPMLYGQPTAVVAGEPSIDVNQNYTLTSGTIPLAAIDGNLPRLAFNVTSKNVSAQAYVGLTLSYQITHMEFDRTAVPGIDNYVQTQWLVFVNPLTVKPLGTQYVPILDRALPVPPTAQNQTAVAAHRTDQPTTGLTPAQLATWDYGFTYSYPAAAQDDVSITITLNAPATGWAQNASAGTSSPLFVALAGFVTNYPAISDDLDTYLTQITGLTSDATIIGNATAAVTALQTLVTGVATTYADQFAPKSKAFGDAVDPTTPIAFDATLESQSGLDGNALICLRNITISGVKAAYDAGTGTIGNGTLTLPAPVIEILSDQYTATVVDTPPPGVTLAYYYPAATAGSGTPPLSFSAARDEANRAVSVSGLNVMVYKSARSSMFAERNKILTPDSQVGTVSTNPDFLFRTPVVTFTDPILPRITWPSYALRQVTPVSGTDVVAYMTGFFASLFEGASGTIKLGMGGGYSYSVAPGVADLPRTYIPLNLLQPIPVTVTTSPPPAAAIQVTEQVNEWFATVVPTTATGAAMDFSINLFSDLTSEQLLLTIGDLYFTTDK